MKSSNKNLIKRHVLEIRLKKKEMAYQIQNQISAIFYARILKVLDVVCSKVVPNDQYIQFNRLEIDLGTVSLLHLEDEFTEKVHTYFYETLFDQVNQLQLESQSESTKKICKSIGTKRDSTLPFHPRTNSRIISQKTSELELLQHFLKTGTFPWWAEKQSGEKLEKTFLKLLKTFPEETKSLIESELANENARQRVIYQFSNTLLFKIVEELVPEKSPKIGHIINDFYEICKRVRFISAPEPEIRLFIWDKVLIVLLTRHQKEISEKEIINFIIKSISGKYNLSYHELIPLLHGSIDRLIKSQFVFHREIPKFIANLNLKQYKKGIKDSVAIDKQKAIHKFAQELIDSPKDMRQPGKELSGADTGRRDVHPRLSGLPGKTDYEQEVSGLIASKSLNETEQLKTDQKRTEIDVQARISDLTGKTGYGQEVSDIIALKSPYEAEQLKTDQKGDDVDVQEIYIENAGLVLLWPYYSTFFKNAELLIDGKFIDETSATRAIHLLQFLVTNKQDSQEHLLPLNKLLCGWDVSKPVCKEFKMSDSEKAECEKILSTVISHWSALKNTSIEGFRTSFLQRNGALVKVERNWLLRVERKTYDMLLDRLPWGLSMVKLSWMKTLLNIEW